MTNKGITNAIREAALAYNKSFRAIEDELVTGSITYAVGKARATELTREYLQVVTQSLVKILVSEAVNRIMSRVNCDRMIPIARWMEEMGLTLDDLDLPGKSLMELTDEEITGLEEAMDEDRARQQSKGNNPNW